MTAPAETADRVGAAHVDSGIAPVVTVPRRSRVRTPRVLQMETNESGAACLGMVLGSYERFVDLDELCLRCGVANGEGATAQSISQAAEHFGLDATIGTYEPEELKSLALPLIINWRFHHDVVVEGWRPGHWYLNDPARGPRVCTDEEFDAAFTGLTIEAVPSPVFEQGGEREKSLRRLVSISGNIGPALVAVTIITLLLIIPTVLIPQVMSLYGAQLSGVVGISALTAVVGLVIAMLVQTGLLALQGALAIRVATKVSVRLGASIVHQLLRLPASFHLQRGASSIAQRASLIDSTSDGVSALALTMTAGVLTSVIAALILLVIEPLTGIAAILVAIATGLFVHRTARRAQHTAARTVTESVSLGAAAAAALAQIDSIKASGWEDGVIARVVATQNRLLEADQAFGVLRLRLGMLPPALTGIGMIGITGVTMLQVVLGTLPASSVLAVIALTAILIAPVGQIVEALDKFHVLEASLDQIDEIIEAHLEDKYGDGEPLAAPDTLDGRLEVRDVSFGYNELAPPIIKALDLRIEPGGRVALVGKSGCGKSTVARLVAGLFDPWAGEILIDGIGRHQHAPQVLADGIALVDQDVAIFDGTLRENITLWDSTVPDVDIMAALADAQLADDVAQWSGGLEARLSEGGSDLSGGQRQRLEIARALVRRPALLILDEATTAIDTQTERLIDEAIRRRGTSCLIIAHRLSTVRNSDDILVLDHGVVIERGSHDELMDRKAAYAEMVESG